MKLKLAQLVVLLSLIQIACGTNPYLGSSCDDGIDNDGDLRTDNDDPDCDSAISDGEIVCPDALALCGLRCVNRQTDFRHCGQCNKACAAQQACVESVCVAADGAACNTPLILEQQLVTVSSANVPGLETPCEPPPYEYSTFFQLNVKRNADDKLILDLGLEQDRVVYVYTDCRPTQLGCFEGASAQVPDMNLRFQTILLEVNHPQDRLASQPIAKVVAN